MCNTFRLTCPFHRLWDDAFNYFYYFYLAWFLCSRSLTPYAATQSASPLTHYLGNFLLEDSKRRRKECHKIFYFSWLLTYLFIYYYYYWVKINLNNKRHLGEKKGNCIFEKQKIRLKGFSPEVSLIISIEEIISFIII